MHRVFEISSQFSSNVSGGGVSVSAGAKNTGGRVLRGGVLYKLGRQWTHRCLTWTRPLLRRPPSLKRPCPPWSPPRKAVESQPFQETPCLSLVENRLPTRDGNSQQCDTTGGRIGHTNCDRQYVRVFSFPLLGRKSSFMFSRSDDRRVVKSCHGNRSSSAVKLRGSGQADLERNNRTRNDLVSSLERSWLVKFRTTKKTRARTKQWVEQKKRGCFLMFDVFLFKQQKQPWGIARARAERERERDRDSFRWSVWKKIKTIFFSSSSP